MREEPNDSIFIENKYKFRYERIHEIVQNTVTMVKNQRNPKLLAMENIHNIIKNIITHIK